ncbi:hypothetical protein [Streptomyces sp. TS71-3]|uniref:hypothetical protein n=1 Tax=Streptomyces sp. TS71-3 TaxID=2733862 RepID=UPI001B203BA0|nr:hypothetical protein [Streptomyces sp. TS71-3]GHJ39828.1 hypothetical protein Sm713_54370 [Streptomyces sp. TS71-3]
MLDAHAATVQPMSPFLFVVGGRPTVLINLDGLTEADPDDADPAELARAVTEGRCLLTAVYRSLPTYPVLCFMLLVYDGHFPYRFDGVRDVTTPDVQDFTAALCRDGGRGRILLHHAGTHRRLATGTFTYRQTPFARPDLPYRTKSAELRRLWETLGIAARGCGRFRRGGGISGWRRMRSSRRRREGRPGTATIHRRLSDLGPTRPRPTVLGVAFVKAATSGNRSAASADAHASTKCSKVRRPSSRAPTSRVWCAFQLVCPNLSVRKQLAGAWRAVRVGRLRPRLARR